MGTGNKYRERAKNNTQRTTTIKIHTRKKLNNLSANGARFISLFFRVKIAHTA